jgi:hypothetical protein
MSRSGVGRGQVHGLVDPEALVLISLVLLNHERRLADLLHDWTVRNSDLLSVQRLKNLAAEYPDVVHAELAGRLAWFARVALTAGKDLRWRSLANDAVGVSGADELPSIRAGVKTRAVRARITEPSALLLRLRLGFGVGVKADLLGYLLGRAEEWVTVRDIVGATVYTSAAVRRAAEDLAAAQFVQALDGQPAMYRAERVRWMDLLQLEEGPPRWRSWQQRFTFVAALLAWVDTANDRPLSRYAFGAKGRELLEQYRPAFERDLIAVWSAHTPVADWAVFIERAVRSLARWMREMA